MRSEGWRRTLSIACLVIAAILGPLGVIAAWANTTLYDSNTFADRSVDLLRDPDVRHELAERITDTLGKNGNQQAVVYRPAFVLAVDAAVDTDTFRSIFRTAVYRAHRAVEENQGTGDATSLDLSDSITIITNNLTLPTNPGGNQAGANNGGGLGKSLGDVVTKLDDYHVFDLQPITAVVMLGGFLGSFAFAGLSLAFAVDRRSDARRLTWALLAGGLIVTGIAVAVPIVVGSLISPAHLGNAVAGGMRYAISDLLSIGLTITIAGLVAVAAARADEEHRLTPAHVRRRAQGWLSRRQATTGGRVLLGVGAIVVAAILVTDPAWWAKTFVFVGALWLGYLGLTELVLMLHGAAFVAAEHRHRLRTAIVVVATVFALLLTTVAGIALTRRAATKANAAGVQRCNGSADLCASPINFVMFPASHNSMAAAAYPNWLFAEQLGTITAQLDKGVRGLLIDTHYGIPSSVHFPGSEQPLILTDKTHELTVRSDDANPDIEARAKEIAAKAPPLASATRGVYLCHSSCEMGAVTFQSQMVALRDWLNKHPQDVVMTVIEDHTSVADNVKAMEAAGLKDKAYVLRKNQPLPTMGQIINSGHNLIVMAERGDKAEPAWYPKAYDWFQETPYTWKTTASMNCNPLRGNEGNPLMLINHWTAQSPADPAKTGSEVNSAAVLDKRIRQCVFDRGIVPTLVAVNFAELGKLVPTVNKLNIELQGIIHRLRAKPGAAGENQAAGTTTTTAGAGSTFSLANPTPVASLTGGEPATFCRLFPALIDTMSAWALSIVAAPPGARGVPDLSYAPLAAVEIGGLERSAPAELAARLAPAQSQSATAIAVLRGLGFSQEDLDNLAATARTALSQPDADPVQVQLTLRERLEKKLGAQRLASAAAAFDRDHPQLDEQFDLGAVSPALATSSGYGCLADA